MSCPPDTQTAEVDGAGAFLAAHVIFGRYVLFAAVAGAANLVFQELTLRLAPGVPVMLSVLLGTGVGFFVKYVLDKRWVFLDDYEGHLLELRKITLYGFLSVGTTLLFWAVELGAWHYWHTPSAKYAGGAIGLALGNWIKYLLDRQFVFRRRNACR